MKEKYLIYKLSNNPGEGGGEAPKITLDLSDAALAGAEAAPKVRDQSERKEAELIDAGDVDISLNPEDGTDVITFGGENTRITVTGEEVHNLIGVSDPNVAEHVYVAINDKEAYPASWDNAKNQYAYTDGRFKGQKVRFLNNNKYEVSSDSERRVAELARESGKPSDKPGVRPEIAEQIAEVKRIVESEPLIFDPIDVDDPYGVEKQAAPKPDKKLGIAGAVDLDGLLSDAATVDQKFLEGANEAGEAETALRFTPKQKAEYDQLAALVEEGEAALKPSDYIAGGIRISMLKRRIERNKKREAEELTAQVKDGGDNVGEFPSKIETIDTGEDNAKTIPLGVDGRVGIETNIGLALYNKGNGLTMVPDKSGQTVAVYGTDDNLSRVVTFGELGASSQKAMKALMARRAA